MPSRSMVFETGVSNLKRSRSKFDLSHKNTLTMVAGKLYPFLAYTDVLPGDTHIMDLSVLCRSTTPITAVMDDAYIQCEFWWVPNQLLLSRASMSPSTSDAEHSWKAFIGAQEALLNVGLLDSDDPMLPVLAYDGSGVTHSDYLKSVSHFLDYPYIPVSAATMQATASGKRDNLFFNPFALLGFYQVWSDAYREPNLWYPVTYSLVPNSSVYYFSFTKNDHAGISTTTGNIYALGLPDVCREHGYFGSALPWPQRNLNPVQINLMEPLKLSTGADYRVQAMAGGNSFVGFGNHNNSLSYSYDLFTSGGASGSNSFIGYDTSSQAAFDPTASTVRGIDTTNLYADLTKVGSVTINTLRYSFALQAYYEALGRMGNRYDDIIRMYGVTVDKCDACQSEYLGGKRIPLNNSQVVASAATTNSPVGSIGGFSNTADYDHYFTKSFTDFGVIVGVAFIRHHDTFWNNLSKERSRCSRFDYYNPYFARIGETPIYRNELFVNWDSSYKSGSSVIVDYVNNPEFGFQEYGAEYRYHEDTIHGEVLPTQTYKYWTYASDWFTLLSTYGTGSNIDDLDLGFFLDGSLQVDEFDQTLETSSSTARFQFIAQFYMKWIAVRNVPAHSIPVVLGQR